MASPLRLRILRLCLDQALTNKQIADHLGRDPASVLYHVRRLVRTGFLVPEPERRGARNAREVPYRATGKSWVLEVVDPVMRRHQDAAIVQASLDEIAEVGHEEVKAARLALRLTGDERREFLGRLQQLLDEYVARPSEGEPVAMFVAVYPDRRPAANPRAEAEQA